MNENHNPEEHPYQDLESLLPDLEDSWSVFAVDVVKSDVAKSRGYVGLWAGTNSPVINEIFGQKAREKAYPYEPEQLGLVPDGHNGLYFMMSKADFENEEKRAEIIAALGKEAEAIAKEQGYDFHSLGDMTGERGIFQRALRTTASMRKLGPSAMGLGYGNDGEVEEEE
jgi:hypothetical protein